MRRFACVLITSTLVLLLAAPAMAGDPPKPKAEKKFEDPLTAKPGEGEKKFEDPLTAKTKPKKKLKKGHKKFEDPLTAKKKPLKKKKPVTKKKFEDPLTAKPKQ